MSIEISEENSSENNGIITTGTSAVTNSMTNINRDWLRKCLERLGYTFSNRTRDRMTEDQAGELFDWMDSHPHDEDQHDSDEMNSEVEYWKKRIPEFVRVIPNGHEKYIFLELASLGDPEILDVDAVPVPEIVATEVVNKSADADLQRENNRLNKAYDLIKEANEIVMRRTADRTAAESRVASAKSALKESQADLDAATADLSRVIADCKSGQQQLPFDEPPVASAATGNADSNNASPASSEPVYPIELLSDREMKKLVGSDVIDSQKAQDDPIGLSAKLIEKLANSAKEELKSVQDLEAWMRSDAYWHDKISGCGEKGIQRIVSTLAAFRRAKPMPA